MIVQPNDGIVALMTAEQTAMCKLKGERHTEFVKRIVSTYHAAYRALYGIEGDS